MDYRTTEMIGEEERASNKDHISVGLEDQPMVCSVTENLKFDSPSVLMLQQNTSFENLPESDINEDLSHEEQNNQDKFVSADQDCDPFPNIVKYQKQCRIDQTDDQHLKVLPTMVQSQDLPADSATEELLDFDCPKSADHCAVVEGSSEKQELHRLSLVNECDLCDKVFTSESSYIEHLAGHKTAKGYKCYECNHVAGYKSLFKLHFDTHIGFQTILKNYIPFSYVCKYCNDVYKLKSEIINHCACHKTADGLKCLICGKILKSTAAFKSHHLGHLADITQVSEKMNQEIHQIKACTKSSIIGTDCIDDIKEMETDKTSERGSSAETTLYKCNFCDTKFESKSKALIHTDSHRTDKGFKCYKCSHISSTKHNLVIHFATCLKKFNKLQSKPNTCCICGTIHYLQSSLQDHFEEHLTMYGYKCHLCHVVPLSQRHDLKRHYVTHLNQLQNGMYVSSEPYMCKICYINFESELEYRSHCDGHRAVNGFKCQLCFTVRSTRQSLKFHYVIHSLEIYNVNQKS